MARSRDKETTSKIPLKSCYNNHDLAGFDPEKELGQPGAFPFTRGIQPEMYRSRLWTMRQYAGFGTAAESNARFKYLLNLGQMGLSVAFDLPTQMGMDSDAELAAGEVGRVGVAIDSLRDMEVLLDQIPLDRVSISMTINSTAAILLAMTIAVAKKQGIALDKLSGTVQNDVLKEYVARGTYIYPPEASLRLTTDIMGYCSQFLSRWNPISISGYHIREAGASAVQEVAFTLGNAIAYVESALRSGLELDSFAPRLSFFFNVHNHFLEEIGKFRAARRLWANIMRFRFGAKNSKSWLLRFHAQTAGSTLTAQQPEVNASRVALQALAAVLGGVQSLHTNSCDEALSLPTEAAARLALRTQQVIAYETGVADIVDPLGGSFAIEALTNAIEERSSEYLKRIDEMGGMIAAISSGYVQREIQQSAFEYQKSIECGERVVVGVNQFISENDFALETYQPDPRIQEEQLNGLRRVKSERNMVAVGRSLDRLEIAAKGQQNLLPFIITAVEAYATVGEISNKLREVFGEHQP